MEDEYLTNLNTDDNELLTKLKRKEEELTKIKSELDEKSKLCLSQKHKIEDLTIENNDLVKKYDNQQNLLKFYEEKASKEEDNNKDLDEIENYNEIEKKSIEEIKDFKERARDKIMTEIFLQNFIMIQLNINNRRTSKNNHNNRK